VDTIKFRIIGSQPVMMHNGRLANPLDPYTKACKRISSKTKKSDEDYEKLSRIEWEGGLYFDERGIFFPAENIFACLIEGGKRTRKGKEVERKVEVVEDAILQYEGMPKRFTTSDSGLDKLAEKFRDMRMVRIKGTRILRTRPFFPKWSLEFTVETELDPDVLVEIVRDAGRYARLGDFRKRYGRFTIDSWEILDN